MQIIFITNLLIQTGVWVRNFAVLLYVVEITNANEIAVSMVTFAEFAPMLIFSFIGGAFADRWRPRLTIFWCNMIGACSIFGILFTIHLGNWKLIVMATFLSVVTLAFALPSVMKLIKNEVSPEHVQNAININQTIVNIFVVIGPLIGTFVYNTYGIYISLSIEIITFLIAGILILLLPKVTPTETEQDEKTSVTADLIAGIKYVYTNQTLRYLSLCFLVVGFAVGLVMPMHVFLVTEQLNKPKEFLEWILMSQGIGLIVGSFITIKLQRIFSSQKIMIMGHLLYAGILCLLGINHNFVLGLCIMLLAGIAIATIQISINTLIIKTSDQNFIGRVNGVVTPLFTTSSVISISMAGVLKYATSLSIVYFVAASFAFVAFLLLLPIYKDKKEISDQTA